MIWNAIYVLTGLLCSSTSIVAFFIMLGGVDLILNDKLKGKTKGHWRLICLIWFLIGLLFVVLAQRLFFH